jgi:hypothetical protein
MMSWETPRDAHNGKAPPCEGGKGKGTPGLAGRGVTLAVALELELEPGTGTLGLKGPRGVLRPLSPGPSLCMLHS